MSDTVTITLEFTREKAERLCHGAPLDAAERKKLRAILDAPEQSHVSSGQLDDDAPILLQVRESVCELIEGYDLRGEEGDLLHADDGAVVKLANEVSDAVKRCAEYDPDFLISDRKLAEHPSSSDDMPAYTKLDPGEVRDFLDCHGEEAVSIGTTATLEATTEICPECQGDVSGGGIDEPQPHCDRCELRGRVPKSSGDQLREAMASGKLRAAIADIAADNGDAEDIADQVIEHLVALTDKAPADPAGGERDA